MRESSLVWHRVHLCVSANDSDPAAAVGVAFVAPARDKAPMSIHRLWAKVALPFAPNRLQTLQLATCIWTLDSNTLDFVDWIGVDAVVAVSVVPI